MLLNLLFADYSQNYEVNIKHAIIMEKFWMIEKKYPILTFQTIFNITQGLKIGDF